MILNIWIWNIKTIESFKKLYFSLYLSCIRKPYSILLQQGLLRCAIGAYIIKLKK